MAVNSAYITANTSAQNVTFTGKGQGIAVINLDGAGIIFCRRDSVTAAAADENHMIPAAAGAFKVISGDVPGGSGAATISVYATATTKVGLEVVNS